MMFLGCINAVNWNMDGTVNGRGLMRKSPDCGQSFGGKSPMLTGTIGSCDGSLLNSVYRWKGHGLEALHRLIKLISSELD